MSRRNKILSLKVGFKVTIEDIIKRLSGKAVPNPVPDEMFDVLYETYKVMANIYDPQTNIEYRIALSKTRKMVKEKFPNLDED